MMWRWAAKIERIDADSSLLPLFQKREQEMFLATASCFSDVMNGLPKTQEFNDPASTLNADESNPVSMLLAQMQKMEGDKPWE